MKVLIVSQYFWPENFRINDVVRSLVQKGVAVDVLTGKPNYPGGEKFPGYKGWGPQLEQFMGAQVFRVPLAARGHGRAIKLALNYLSFVISGVLFGSWMLRKRRYDVIFVYAPSPILQALPAIFLGWLKRCGVIVWVQDLWPESLSATGYVKNPRALGIVEKVVRFIYRHTDLLLVQSEAFVAKVAALAPGKRIEYYPNSVDATFAAPPDIALPEIPGLNDGFPIMFAGNLGTGQAVEAILEAATLLREHSDIRFVIVGQGSRRDWMLQEVIKRNLTNIYLPGQYPIEVMPGLMQKAAILLVTLADQPIFAATVPSKVQAYMAAGRPVLACLNGEGANLIRKAGAGLTCPAEDAQGLAQAVLHFYKMTAAEREQIGENGRRYFKEHFDQDVLTDQLISHFRAISELKKGR